MHQVTVLMAAGACVYVSVHVYNTGVLEPLVRAVIRELEGDARQALMLKLLPMLHPDSR